MRVMDRPIGLNDPTAVKIKSYRIRQAGKRGLVLTLPAVWVDDLNLSPGARLDVYRDTSDRLIIMPPRREAGAVPEGGDAA